MTSVAASDAAPSFCLTSGLSSSSGETAVLAFLAKASGSTGGPGIAEDKSAPTCEESLETVTALVAPTRQTPDSTDVLTRASGIREAVAVALTSTSPPSPIVKPSPPLPPPAKGAPVVALPATATCPDAQAMSQVETSPALAAFPPKAKAKARARSFTVTCTAAFKIM